MVGYPTQHDLGIVVKDVKYSELYISIEVIYEYSKHFN